jgi:hypothetical protein
VDVSRRAVMPITVLLEPTQHRFTTAVDTLARLGFLRGGKVIGDFTLSFQPPSVSDPT